MSKIGFARVAQVAALSLVLAAPLGSAAFAQSLDTPQAWGAGQSDAFGSDHADQALNAARAPAAGTVNHRIATTSQAAPVVQQDVVGGGGHLDQVYREIYQPGSIPAGNG